MLSAGILKAIDIEYVTIVHLEKTLHTYIIFAEIKVLNRLLVSALKGIDFSLANTGTSRPDLESVQVNVLVMSKTSIINLPLY